jgi:hypothetical protein
MNDFNNSFLICENDTHVGFYRNGVEVGIFNKDSKVMKFAAGHPVHVKEAFNAFFSAALHLEGGINKEPSESQPIAPPETAKEKVEKYLKKTWQLKVLNYSIDMNATEILTQASEANSRAISKQSDSIIKLIDLIKELNQNNLKLQERVRVLEQKCFCL